MLESDHQIVSVYFRKIEDFRFLKTDHEKIFRAENGGFIYIRLDGLHDQWHGYTFNPHLIKLETLQEVGKFEYYKKERHLSRKFRKEGRFVAFGTSGACAHIGFVSVANPYPKNQLAGIRKKIFG